MFYSYMLKKIEDAHKHSKHYMWKMVTRAAAAIAAPQPDDKKGKERQQESDMEILCICKEDDRGVIIDSQKPMFNDATVIFRTSKKIVKRRT